MHGVIWVYCAHDAYCFPEGPVFSGSGNGVFFIVRSVSAGGYSHLIRRQRGQPRGGSPTKMKKRIKLKEL